MPPTPKELTPASSGSGPAQGRSVVLTVNGDVSKSMCGLGRSQPSDGGRVRCCRASTVLIRPAIPDAASRCPMFDFTEPIAQ